MLNRTSALLITIVAGSLSCAFRPEASGPFVDELASEVSACFSTAPAGLCQERYARVRLFGGFDRAQYSGHGFGFEEFDLRLRNGDGERSIEIGCSGSISGAPRVAPKIGGLVVVEGVPGGKGNGFIELRECRVVAVTPKDRSTPTSELEQRGYR